MACLTHCRFALALVGSLVLATSQAPSQEPLDPEAIVTGAVREEESSPDSLVGVGRVPELTDTLIYYALDHSPATEDQVPVIDFYRAVPANYQLSGRKVVGRQIVLDANPEWLVGIDRFTGKVYRLAGFRDEVSTEDYSRLVTDLRFKVTGKEDAMDVFYFVLRLLYGQSFQSRVYSDLFALEADAIADFRVRCGASDRDVFRKWWKRNAGRFDALLRKPRVSRRGDDFEVRYFHYGRGSVYEDFVVFGTDGSFKDHGFEEIVEEPKTSKCEWNFD